MVLAAIAIFIERLLVLFNSFFFELELALLLSHLVGELLKHGDLLASFIVHNRRLHAQFRVIRPETLL